MTASSDFQFAMIPVWVMERLNGGRSHAACWPVYCWLSHHADRNGESCFPSYTTLAEETGLGRQTVINAVSLLEELGLLTVTARYDENRQTTNDYLVHRAPPEGYVKPYPPGYVKDDPRGYVKPYPEQEPEEQEPEEQAPLPPKGGSDVEPTIAFDFWWGLWPKKQGKANAERKWNRMTLAEKQAAMEQVPLWIDYVDRHPEGNKYVPMASTYINQKRWLDDMPQVPEAATRVQRTRSAAERFLDRHQPQSNPRRELT